MLEKLTKIIVLFSAALLAGCAQQRPAVGVTGCNFRALPLLQSDEHPRGFGDPVKSFNDELIQVLSTRPITTSREFVTSARREFLVLSGGSQHGAFGTGFFYGQQHIPNYDVVTGVSTGALQSTFLFLANEPVPADRSYAFNIGILPDGLHPGISSIGDAAIATSITAESDILKVDSSGILGAVQHGSEASFAPLRARLKQLISNGTLDQIAAAGARNPARKLYVGVTDLDNGYGYAIDLTELAGRVTNGASHDQIRQCYIDALIASSSVPGGAYPVSLDIVDIREPTHVRQDLFVDGGARYGVFLKQVRGIVSIDNPIPSNVSLIVNGGLYESDWTDSAGKRPEKWSILTLAMRTIDQLENQSYRSSVDAVEQFGLSHGALKMAFISPENLGLGAKPADEHRFRDKTCAEWTAIDNLKKPLEFHPNYMACLFDYGRERGKIPKWNIDKSATPQPSH